MEKENFYTYPLHKLKDIYLTDKSEPDGEYYLIRKEFD